MKAVDVFFKCILSIQNYIEKIENWYISRYKYTSLVSILSIVIAMLLSLCKQIILGEIFFIFGIVYWGFGNIVGWKHSVRRWLKICFIYNLYFSAIATGILQRVLNKTISDFVLIMVYSIVWIFLSLISNSNVALLVNEIVSGIATTIFTIGTYLIGEKQKNMMNLEDYLSYSSDDTVKRAMIDKSIIADELTKIMIFETLEKAFLFLLPIIGVSALCIIMVKIKIYWMGKNNISEPEIELGYNEK